MNWEAIGAIGESLGAFAVFVSLVYLATQIRSQNKESRIASVHDITEAFRQSTGLLCNPEISQIYAKGIRGTDGLEEWELISFIATVQLLLRVWEEAFHQNSENRLDGSTWTAMETQYCDLISAEGVQEVWAIRKLFYRQEFREYVESLDLRKRKYRFRRDT